MYALVWLNRENKKIKVNITYFIKGGSLSRSINFGVDWRLKEN